MASPWNKQFEDWMLNRGVVNCDRWGRPDRAVRPMTKSTVRNRLKGVMPIMKALGYLGNGAKTLRELTAQEIVDHFEKVYPDRGASNPNIYNLQTVGMRKLAEFIYFEVKYRRRPVWTVDDVVLVKDKTPKAYVEHADLEIDEDFLERYQLQFLPWLKEKDPPVYAMLGWMFYTELRYFETQRAHVDLDDLVKGSVMRCRKSGIYDPKGTYIKVDRKKKSGRKNTQKLYPMEDLWDLLEWWREHREAVPGVESLFVSNRGEPWSEHTSGFNRALRKAALKSGLFKGSCTPGGDKATGEISMFKSHTLGRKAGITFDIHSGASDVDAMKRSGHTDPKVFHTHYPKVDAASSTRRISDLHDIYWAKRNGGGSDQVEDDIDVDLVAEELLADPRIRAAMVRKLKEELLASLGDMT